MSITPEFAFDVCWEVYRNACAQAFEQGGVHAIDGREGKKERTEGKRRRPEAADFVADFALAGAEALRHPRFASRLILFRVYFLALAPYEHARHFLGIGERTWANWTEEIRQRVGKELMRKGLFPPRKYFGG